MTLECSDFVAELDVPAPSFQVLRRPAQRTTVVYCSMHNCNMPGMNQKDSKQKDFREKNKKQQQDFQVTDHLDFPCQDRLQYCIDRGRNVGFGT